MSGRDSVIWEWRDVRRRRGSVAVAALACLVVALVIVIGLTTLCGGALTVGSRARNQTALRALAEAGLQYGYWQYAWQNQALPYTAGSYALGPGTFSTTVTDNSAAIVGTVKVVSTATIGSNSLTETRIFPYPSAPNYGNFQGASTLTNNGSGALIGSRLRLTDGNLNEVTTDFHNTQVPIIAFHTQFTFQLVDGTAGMPGGADGFTFCIQTAGPSQKGPMGGSLGYGPNHTGGSPGIPHSVAVKFDLGDNQGEGNNSTGLYVNGAAPTIPATNLNGTGINLHSGHIMQANMAYSGATLTVTITDTVTNATATQTYTVDIASVVGSNTAYVGFTGSTGGATATQDILSWTYTSP